MKLDRQALHGLMATGLLTTQLHRASNKEVSSALQRFRTIYLDGDTRNEDVFTQPLKSILAELNARYGLAKTVDRQGRQVLVPRNLLRAENSDDPNQSFYTAAGWRVQLYTFRWPLQRNPPQEMMDKIIRKARKSTFQSIRHTDQQFALRARSIRQRRNGTEFLRHQVQHAFAAGGHIVGVYFSFLDQPTPDFATPAYIKPQVEYWKTSAIGFVDQDVKARDEKINNWVKATGLTDQHASELKALAPVDSADKRDALDRMLTRWSWQQSMLGLSNVITNTFHEDNRLNTIEISDCHKHRKEHKDYRDVRIVFGTNRLDTTALSRNDPDPDRWFSAEADTANSLNVGCAMISVPTDESALAALRTQFHGGWFHSAAGRARDDANLYRVTNARYLGQNPARAARHRLQLIDREKWKFKEEGRALVFVHGYNTSFEYALLTAAQIAGSIKYPGRVYLFSWPSAARMMSYASDMDSAERSEFHVAGFLRALFTDPDLKKLDIIAHSMGSQTLLRSLADLSDIFFSRHDIRLGQIVFAAPDVSDTVFADKIREFSYLAENVTVYSSENDKALLLSKHLRRQGSRIGLMVGSELPRISRVRYFDATSGSSVCNLWGWYGIEHGYFAANPIVRRHLSTILTKSLGLRNKYARVGDYVRRTGLGRFKLDFPPERCFLGDVRDKAGELLSRARAATGLD